MAECPFCRLLGSRRHAARIAEFEHSVAFLHLDQTHPGRSVLILKRHFDHYHELPEPLFTAFNRDLRRLAAALLRELRPQRLNYAVLGNVVPHVHWHLIPRYLDDPNPGAPPWPAGEPRRLTADQYAALARRLGLAVAGRDDAPPSASGPAFQSSPGAPGVRGPWLRRLIPNRLDPLL
ncbi:protein of unknown function [Candidatus Methylocalor cossyra]|uniref:HIT domain-containing protein n=2 Tax=Candidatus Methylocalor cossyra TaxID=3108543 RepID=A0ABP1C3Q3_9GAMM